jgi:hypothetical protein
MHYKEKFLHNCAIALYVILTQNISVFTYSFSVMIPDNILRLYEYILSEGEHLHLKVQEYEHGHEHEL